MLSLVSVFYLPYTLFYFVSGNHKLTETFYTSEPEIHSRTDHEHFICTAGVIFFHRQYITGTYIQSSSSLEFLLYSHNMPKRRIFITKRLLSPKNRTLNIIPQISFKINISRVYFILFVEKQ